MNAAIASGIAPHRHAVQTTIPHHPFLLLPRFIAIPPHFPAGMQCSARKASKMNGGSSSTTRQSQSATAPGVGSRTRVRAVRFTALVPAFRLTPSWFPSLSITAIPVRVSLKRIKYTFAAPAHATANQGMHYTLRDLTNAYLAQQTATTKTLDQLVTGQSHTHRHDSGRAVRLSNVLPVRLSRRVTVAVVEHSVVGLVGPLPKDHIQGLRESGNSRFIRSAALTAYRTE